MRLGVMLPLGDIGGEPNVLRDFSLAAEEMGYTNLGLPDHVLGANVATHPEVVGRNTSVDLFHDPFVAFGFLAAVCRTTTEFSTQVLILAQRQAVLVAKQAASLDLLCGERFRLGVGVGWNPVEFVGLNEKFHNRGRRSEEQVEDGGGQLDPRGPGPARPGEHVRRPGVLVLADRAHHGSRPRDRH